MKIIAISDTHQYHKFTLPDGDVLIHAGDFCASGRFEDAMKFGKWLQEQPHKHKIVVAGNHDKCFRSLSNSAIKELFFGNKENIHYLQDDFVIIDGITFYGAPWTPAFMNWEFMYHSHEAKEIWDRVPQGVQVLITHGPAKGILDYVPDQNVNLGCPALLAKIIELKPDIHICGHIHEGAGQHSFNGTTFYNVAIMDGDYRPINPVTVIDYEK